jgi:hypothetical protein
MKKLKPGYNSEEIQGQLVDKVCEYFGRVYDDVEVQSYLPYEKVIYMMEERSVNADRVQRFRERWGGYKKR